MIRRGQPDGQRVKRRLPRLRVLFEDVMQDGAHASRRPTCKRLFERRVAAVAVQKGHQHQLELMRHLGREIQDDNQLIAPLQRAHPQPDVQAQPARLP